MGRYMVVSGFIIGQLDFNKKIGDNVKRQRLFRVVCFVMVVGVSGVSSAASILLLNGVEATGTSSAVYLENSNPITVDLYWTNSDGAVTALTIDVEGSSDNSHYHQLASHALNANEITAKAAAFHVTDKLFDYVRFNITTLTETGTTSVYARLTYQK